MPLHKSLRGHVCVFVTLLGMIAGTRSFAGSAVIGSVAGSKNATIDGQAVLPNTTIVSGESLEVNDGAAVVTIGNTSRMVFGRQTTVSFLREGDEVTVLLSRGDLSVYHPQDGVELRVKVGEVTIVPGKGFKTVGEVAMVGGSVVISAKEGLFRVEASGSAVEVAKGKVIAVPVKAAARAGSSSPAGAQVGFGNTNTILEAGALSASGVAAVLAGISISRANGARDAANAANTTAASAVTAANNATAAANAAGATANSVGCAIDKVTPSVTINGTAVSPYTPPAGSSC